MASLAMLMEDTRLIQEALAETLEGEERTLYLQKLLDDTLVCTNRKVDSVVWILEQRRAHIELVAKQVDELVKYKKQLEEDDSKMRRYIVDLVESEQIPVKVCGQNRTLNVCRNSQASVHVDPGVWDSITLESVYEYRDQENWGDAMTPYVRKVVEYRVDTKALAQAHSEGKQLPTGVTVQTRKHVRIGWNRSEFTQG